jgi:hypothetical protein
MSLFLYQSVLKIESASTLTARSLEKGPNNVIFLVELIVMEFCNRFWSIYGA